MTPCFFVSDLHGSESRYEKLFDAIERLRPQIVFVGGDLLPHYAIAGDVLNDTLGAGLQRLRDALGFEYPEVLVILGNDDPRKEEATIQHLEERRLLTYIHDRRVEVEGTPIYGYGCVPPTPFLNKDWEKYDVSRYVPPGAVSPEEGFRSVPVQAREIRYSTIAKDLEALAGGFDMSGSIWLVHTPPSDTKLDRVARDGQMIDYVPLDLNVGSIALRRFIESNQPQLTLHGHIHESARMTGSWRDRIGNTLLFSAAHDGPELALVRFNLENPEGATRDLL